MGKNIQSQVCESIQFSRSLKDIDYCQVSLFCLGFITTRRLRLPEHSKILKGIESWKIPHTRVLSYLGFFYFEIMLQILKTLEINESHISTINKILSLSECRLGEIKKKKDSNLIIICFSCSDINTDFLLTIWSISTKKSSTPPALPFNLLIIYLYLINTLLSIKIFIFSLIFDFYFETSSSWSMLRSEQGVGEKCTSKYEVETPCLPTSQQRRVRATAQNRSLRIGTRHKLNSRDSATSESDAVEPSSSSRHTGTNLKAEVPVPNLLHKGFD